MPAARKTKVATARAVGSDTSAQDCARCTAHSGAASGRGSGTAHSSSTQMARATVQNGAIGDRNFN
jgi:hypothetical protein